MEVFGGDDECWRREDAEEADREAEGADRSIEGKEGQMNMQSGPCVLFWLPSDSTNHSQMLREGRGEDGRGRKEETGQKEQQYGNRVRRRARFTFT